MNNNVNVVTLNAIKKIAKTIPIGYYLGRGVSLTVEEGDETYCLPMEDKVVVGAGHIIESLKTIDSKEDPEWLVRTLIFHEIAHLILSPKEICEGSIARNISRKFFDDAINVFEDERIETLLKDFFWGVDFPRAVRTLNGYDESRFSPTTFRGYCFGVIRFHHGDSDLVEMVRNIISQHKHLTVSNGGCRNFASNYLHDLECLFEKLLERWGEQENQKNQNKNNSQSGSQKNKSNRKKSKQTDKDRTSHSEKEHEGGETENENLNKKNQTTSSPLTNEQIKRIIKKESRVMFFEDSTITARITSVIKKFTNKIMFQSHANLNRSGSGKVNSRAVGLSKDYRWFKITDGDDSSKFDSKIHFNLWVDTSGSFYNSMPRLNALIKALSLAEKSIVPFSFDVISMSNTCKLILDKKDALHAKGGNLISEEFIDVSKALKRKTSQNNTKAINICVWDGDLNTDGSFRPGINNARKILSSVFDNYDTIIVADCSNEKYFVDFTEENDICPKAKKTFISGEYGEKFINAVFDQLNKFV